MSKSPFPYSCLEEQNEELLSQEITSYVKRDKSVIKITIKREFADGDYTDSMTTEVLHSW